MKYKRLGIKVLWVDDDEGMQELGQLLIYQLGCTGDYVKSSSEAVERLKSDQYDLLITDIGLPDMSGIDLAILAKETQYNIRVVFVTGWANDFSDEERLKLGGSVVMVKPLDLENIRGIVEKLCSKILK